MARNTSILLGDYFNEFIGHQVETGRFSSASEVVRTALRFYEKELSKEQQLIAELKKGEKSGFVDNFNKNTFLQELHKKHMKILKIYGFILFKIGHKNEPIGIFNLFLMK